MKRILDILLAFVGLTVMSPVLLLFMLLVFLQDFHSPFYLATRVGRGGRDFTMFKLRSMSIGSDKSGVDSTALNDPRITRVGQWIRSYKLDELVQLWNVLVGHMSLVGPRPQVRRDVELYTEVEMGLLAARPGITDFASIVFSDEGDILDGHANPDLAYNQLIRPWKSRLALANIEHASVALDFKIMILTVVAIFSRKTALAGVQRILQDLDVDDDVCIVALRDRPLEPSAPPGANELGRASN